MFALIGAALLFSVRGSNADAGTSVWRNPYCDRGYCVTLSEPELRAEAGLCVVILCSFKTAAGFKPQHIVWYRWEASEPTSSSLFIIFHTNNSIEVQSGFEGRVLLLEPDVSRNNCSIIINDLKQSDSGSYQLRVNGELNGKDDGFTFIPKVTVSVKGLKQKPKVKIPALTDGQKATLTCIAPGLCCGSSPKITWTWRGAGGTESNITKNITSFRTKNQTACTLRHISTLTFNASAKHHKSSITCKITFSGETATEGSSTLNVTYVEKVKLTGATSVREGETLNLTCSVESFPPALIVWEKLSPNTDLQKVIYTDLDNDIGSATLVIPNVTADHTGQYICTAKHLDISVKSYVNVIVTWFSKILTGSGCVLQSEDLTCVCISEGFPLPTIKWLLLENHTEYSVITTVTNHTVNSTVRVTSKNHGNNSAECISNNGNGEAKENLPIKRNLAEKNGPSAVFRLEYLKIIIAFLTGILLTSSICCLAKRCYRKKDKSSGKSDETLEMLTRQDDNLVYCVQVLRGNQTLNSNSEPKEVEYANIDFSLLNRNSARGARRRQESTKTEYAEIKKAVKEEQENDVGRGREILEGQEENVVMELEMKRCEPQKDEGVEAVYSTVNDIINEI